MSVLDRIRGWRPRRGGDGTPAGMVPAERIASEARRAAASSPAEERDRELVARQDRLVERFTMMQADLGGVFYEMAIRDHVRMDVLTRKAAELQRVDAELAEVGRLLRGDAGPPVGVCAACAAPHGSAARFCSRCGAALEGQGTGTPRPGEAAPGGGAQAQAPTATSNGSGGSR